MIKYYTIKDLESVINSEGYLDSYRDACRDELKRRQNKYINFISL